jgi:hypothetical protein
MFKKNVFEINRKMEVDISFTKHLFEKIELENIFFLVIILICVLCAEYLRKKEKKNIRICLHVHSSK